MHGRFGCDYFFADEIDIEAVRKKRYEYVLLFKPVQWRMPALFNNVFSLPDNVTVVGHWDDIHQGTRGTNRLTSDYYRINKYFARCDIILCPYESAFRNWYPKHAHKLQVFPHFFPHSDVAAVPYNPKPSASCLLTGATYRDWYPLRAHASGNPDVTLIPHPGYAKLNRAALYSTAYYIELGKHFAGITCSSVLNYTVAKYFEIPASGSLLLATYNSDMDPLGFVDGKNYIRVSIETYGRTIRDVLKNPERYESIRRAGFELSRNNHSDVNRLELIRDILQNHN
jgi:hypothetical protein